MLGFGITLFLFALLVAAALSGVWKLTIWTNTIGEGWPELVLFLGVITVEGVGLVVHWKTTSSNKNR